MGSGTGAKWLMLLLLYFTIMTVIVTLVSNISPTPITSGGYDLNTNESGVHCSLPRTVYDFSLSSMGVRYLSEKQYYDGNVSKNYGRWNNHISCDYSIGNLGETICEDISGCSWEADTLFWWWETGDEQCRGTFNHTWINQSNVIERFGSNLPYLDEDRGICSHEDVIYNESLCYEMSCTWDDKKFELVIDDIDLNLGMGNKIWNVIKEMVTFKFDFGFENSTANFILSFIIFWLPLIGIGLSVYVLVRS